MIEQLIILDRKITHYKKALKDNKGKKCLKLKIKLWWYERKYERMKERIWK